MTRSAAIRPGGLSLAEGQAMVVESGLAAGCLYAMDALAHRRLTVAGFLLLVSGWILCRIVAGVWARRPGRAGWIAPAVELGGPVLWLALIGPQLKHPWSPPQAAYAVLGIWGTWQVWRWALGRGGSRPAGECWRWLVIGCGALAVVAPYVTDLQLGGRDAKWYTSVYIDFLQQLRAGVFPVFLGQGELSSNGSANLFRSAPLCLWIGGLWDWLTWQSLPLVAIRNMTVISTALAAGYGLYAALVALLSGEEDNATNRWLAAGCALLYLFCPAVLLSLYFYELQMTWTALLALPWILHGNLRSLQDPSGRGYVSLAVGLNLAWLAHAPLAIIATFVTAALQLGRFAFEPQAVATHGRAALRGGLLCGLLSAYYFLGMSELASSGEGSLPREGGLIFGLAVVVVSAVWSLWFGRYRWLAGWAAGAALVGWLAPVWLAWVVAWTALWGLVCWMARAWQTRPGPAPMIMGATVTMLAAAAVAQVWATRSGQAPDEMMMRELVKVGSARADLLRPLGASLGRYGSTQPGYAVWALLLITGIGSFVFRRTGLALVTGVLMFFAALCLDLPLVADFVTGYAPLQVGHAVNFPMLYRLVPVLAVLALSGGFLVLVAVGRRHPRWGLGLLLVGVLWSGGEAGKVVAPGFKQVTDRGTTARMFDPDSYALGRYPYNLLYTPLHYMDGKRAPWLASRLLTPHYDMLVGPEEVAKQMEALGVETEPLTSTVDENYPQWLRFTPGWEVQPGETLVLRFEFDPAMNCLGWLILSSDHGYQEHYLDPQYLGTGFGAHPVSSRVIAVTNSGTQTEHYTMRMKTEAANTLPRDGGVWGRLHRSRYRPELAPVHVKSLVPYRARITMSEDGFLESPRQWIAGYQAVVDGQAVVPERMKSGMLGVPLAAGTHELELRFVGSRRLWAGLIISGGTLLGLILFQLFRDPVRRESGRHLLQAWTNTNRS